MAKLSYAQQGLKSMVANGSLGLPDEAVSAAELKQLQQQRISGIVWGGVVSAVAFPLVIYMAYLLISELLPFTWHRLPTIVALPLNVFLLLTGVAVFLIALVFLLTKWTDVVETVFHRKPGPYEPIPESMIHGYLKIVDDDVGAAQILCFAQALCEAGRPVPCRAEYDRISHVYNGNRSCGMLKPEWDSLEAQPDQAPRLEDQS